VRCRIAFAQVCHLTHCPTAPARTLSR
jgi:hypothetical protein